jgi:hypothetical protein
MSLEWNWLSKQFGMADGSAYARLLDAQSEVHDLVAREVTQNSWDAARRHQAELAAAKGQDAAAERKFRLTYDFKEVSDGDKKRLLTALNAHELVDVLTEHGHGPLKFEKGKTVLDRMNSREPLSLLYVNDYGATGLRGDPVGEGLSESDFFRAFGQIGGNDRAEGGGSFGFGKSAFIKASRIRCVIAYSSFFPQPGDPVTRRLWGFVYWPSFGRKAGVGQLGVLHRDAGVSSAPAVDQVADVMAESFGFQVRTAKSYEDCGTSLLIVDHVLDPRRLMDALEMWWWPAMETYRSTFDISVRTPKEVLRPQPLLNDRVKPYIRAFEIAQDANAQLKEGEFKSKWRAIRDQGVAPGSMAVVRAESSLEDASDHGYFAHVALIRNPRMVVNYEGYSGSSPNTEIKGVYIASLEADSYLRKTEPSTHDRWDTNIDESYGPDWEKTSKVVASIKSRIRAEITEIQRSLRQQPKKAQVPMSWANELFAQLFSEPTKTGKKQSEEERRKKTKRHAQMYDSTLQSRERRTVGSGQIAVQETWSVMLADEVKTEVSAVVDFAAWVLADGNEASASDRLAIEGLVLPKGFKETEDGVQGTFKPGLAYQFSFLTAPYEQDWNVRTDVLVKSQGEAEDSIDEEGQA